MMFCVSIWFELQLVHDIFSTGVCPLLAAGDLCGVHALRRYRSSLQPMSMFENEASGAVLYRTCVRYAVYALSGWYGGDVQMLAFSQGARPGGETLERDGQATRGGGGRTTQPGDGAAKVRTRNIFTDCFGHLLNVPLA